MLMPRRWWLAATPIDLRCGMDRLLVAVQSKLVNDASDGDAFVFCNRARTRIKMLVVDATGVWLCARRLHVGSFVWPRETAARCELDAEQFSWLCAGVDWQRLRVQKTLACRV